MGEGAPGGRPRAPGAAGNATLPRALARDAPTVCTFARGGDGAAGSAARPAFLAGGALGGAEVVCAAASLDGVLSPSPSNGRGWGEPEDVRALAQGGVGVMETFRALEAVLAESRAAGGGMGGDAARAGLRVPLDLRGGALHEIVLEWRDVSGFASAQLLWITPAAAAAAVDAGGDPERDAAPVAVPPSALYSLREIAGSPFLT
jgi:hypothetical protein